MMTKRSTRIQELKREANLNLQFCSRALLTLTSATNSALLNFVESIATDYSSKMDHRTSFDEECRKIQHEVTSANVTVNASEGSLRGVVREDMRIRQMKKNEQIMVTEQQWTRTDTKLIDFLLKTRKTAKKMSQKDYQSSFCHLNNSQGSKAFVDQMFGDRKLRTRIESKPFSDALQVLHTDKDLVFELLAEPDCLLEIRNSCTCQTEKERSNGKRKPFSVGEIKKKLKHTFGGGTRNRNLFGDDCVYRGVETRNTLSFSTSAKAKEKLGKKHGPMEPDAYTVRKKIDFSSKYEVDAVLEANRLISARLIDSNAIGTTSGRSRRTPERIVSPLEHDFWPVSPIRDSRYWSSGQMRFGSYRTNTEVTSCDDGDCKEYDDSIETCSTMILSTDEEARGTMATATRNTKSNDKPEIIETNNVLHSNAPNDTAQRSVKLELYEDHIMHSTLDSVSDNETFTNTVDDVPSTPTSIYHLPESSKYQEEHESPVSVLDQFFAEDVNSPSNNMFQTARSPPKPRRLRFEECSFEQDYVISHYVHLVFQASSLNWDQLTKIRPLMSDELLHSSLFEEVESWLSDSRIDTRLLFDHINEVLLEIQQSHLVSPPWSSATVKRSICCVPLEQVVVDEIMREADFYLLPRTQKRTLDQLVAKDMEDSRLWLHVRPETENIILHISDDILEESILDVILEFYS